DATAARFVPNPFADERRRTNDEGPDSSFVVRPSSDRLYKTGDLVRYRADGQIEYLGRADQQIKIRGFRVELGEIEAVIQRHPAIRASAVVARTAPSGELRLVAYVVTTEDERRTTKEEQRDPSFVLRPSSFVQELRDFLRSQLPDYMQPSAFV